MFAKVRCQAPPRLLEHSLGTTAYSKIKGIICAERRTPKNSEFCMGIEPMTFILQNSVNFSVLGF